MPNWCDNSIRLSHPDKSKLDAFDAEMTKKNESGYFMGCPFQHLRPRPETEEQNWYDWNINNWGTKWDGDLIDYERLDDNEAIFYCNTAWSPPIALLEYLTEQGWTVEAFYHESGMCYCGKYTSEDGDDYYEYDLRDRESLEELPSDIEEYAGLLDYHDSCKENGDFDEAEVD